MKEGEYMGIAMDFVQIVLSIIMIVLIMQLKKKD